MARPRVAGALWAAVWLVACSGGGPASEPLFPADYARTYTEVRGCRQSADHDLNIIRVLASPAALEPYTKHDGPFPVGAVLLKEEHDFADIDCSGPIKQWTVMSRLADGSSPATLDWHWQRVDKARSVIGDNTPACYGCHTGCTADSGGYDHTCTMP